MVYKNHHSETDDTLSAAVAEVMADVLRRRSAGETLDDESIIASHPDLWPRLQEELRSASRIRDAYLASRRAGTANSPIEPMRADELEAPIELDSGYSALGGSLPTIEGYILLDELGCGGQATVFRAKQESTGRTVAIKVLLGGAAAGSRNRARFEREAAILAKINHPNIVSILDRGRTHDGAFFFAMDHIDGLPIDEFVAESQPNPPISLLELWLKIARAFAEAHRNKIVHRDIKPSNILIDQRGEPHILDFGLARADCQSDVWLSNRTVTGQVLGSLPWTSPEQAAGSHHRAKYSSDVYSLGVVLYQTLTGSFPYPVTGTISQMLGHIASTEPKSPSRRADKRCSPILMEHLRLPKGKATQLDAIILKALAKRPEQRYPSAAELAEDLQNVIGDKPISVPQRSRHRPLFVELLILAAVLIAMTIQHKHFVPKPSVSLRQPATDNDFGMSFVRILPQMFFMGSPVEELGHKYDELLHQVAISKTIYMQKTEVTRGQYLKVMGSAPAGMKWEDDNLPATEISWYEAEAFCRELEKKDHHGHYRLPTEAEWELACRAGDDGRFANGGSLDEICWFLENSGGNLHPVATKQPNRWGLYDMEGNTEEWCADYYDSYPVQSKQTLTDPTGPASGTLRVVRGGSYRQTLEKCRCAARGALLPSNKIPTVGFRIVLEPTSSNLVP